MVPRQHRSPRVMIRTKALAVVPRRAGDRAADLERGALGTMGMRSDQPVDIRAQLTAAGRSFLETEEPRRAASRWGRLQVPAQHFWANELQGWVGKEWRAGGGSSGVATRSF